MFPCLHDTKKECPIINNNYRSFVDGLHYRLTNKQRKEAINKYEPQLPCCMRMDKSYTINYDDYSIEHVVHCLHYGHSGCSTCMLHNQTLRLKR